MFDKIAIHSTQREYTPYEKTVIEKRAPTDDSIRIYAEIKEKAYKSILDTIKINDNTFNMSAILCESFDSPGMVCKYHFTLNGKEIVGEIQVKDMDFRFKGDLQKKVFEDASKHIAIELLKIIKVPVRV